MALPPRLTSQDRERNLAKALASRRDCSEVKAKIATRELSIFDAINDPRESIQRMKVSELLLSVPGVGPWRVEILMEKMRISPSRRIRGLGEHQRSALRQEMGVMKVDPKRGTLVVISGPGGVGKSTITKALRNDPRFWISISATTRQPRDGEKNGEDYFFVNDTQFDQMIAANEFLEWASFAGNRYGTPRNSVESHLHQGQNVILEIEIDGARQVRGSQPDALLVFISPPSWEELESRLLGRGTDTPERRQARLDLARIEMAAAPEFDHILVNNEVNQVIEKMVALVSAFRD